MPLGADDDHVTHCIQFTMTNPLPLPAAPDWRALCQELLQPLAEYDDANPYHEHRDLITSTRAALATPPTLEAAAAMGAQGGPPSEAERLAFEAWMRGHSWLVAGVWDGTTYTGRTKVESGGWFDTAAMQTRMLWAAWRDRAALATPPAATREAWDEFVRELGELQHRAMGEGVGPRRDLVEWAQLLMAATREAVDADTDDVLTLAAIIREVQGTQRQGAAALAEAILSHRAWPALLPSPTREAEPLPHTPTLRALLHPAYEPGDGSADGAQLVDEQWWHPVFG